MGVEVNPKNIEKAVKDTLKKNKYITSLTDALLHAGIHRNTFRKYFPKGSEVSDEIQLEIYKNRSLVKVELKKKWGKQSNPITQIALYKLLGTEDEVHRLNGTKTESVNKVIVEQPLFVDDE